MNAPTLTEAAQSQEDHAPCATRPIAAYEQRVDDEYHAAEVGLERTLEGIRRDERWAQAERERMERLALIERERHLTETDGRNWDAVQRGD